MTAAKCKLDSNQHWSLVSAYASVSNSATPRAFTLVISDDVSKTALSTFIAAFIFSVIALIAIKIGIYGRTGLFIVFAMTIFVLGWVVFVLLGAFGRPQGRVKGGGAPGET